MDAGAEDASRGIAADATIIELYVDGEPAAAEQSSVRSWRPVGWGLVVCAISLAIGWALLGSAQRAVELGEIERSVGSDLSGELLGDARVTGVRCVRRTRTDARCVAELFDKSGDGPILQGVTVSIEQSTGDYSWQAGAQP